MTGYSHFYFLNLESSNFYSLCYEEDDIKTLSEAVQKVKDRDTFDMIVRDLERSFRLTIVFLSYLIMTIEEISFGISPLLLYNEKWYNDMDYVYRWGR